MVNSRMEANPNRRRVLQAAGLATVGASIAVFGTPPSATAAGGQPENWVTTLTGAGDEAATIQAAVNSLGVDGGVVRLPPGTYYLGSTITMGSNVTLAGAGITATELRDHANLGNNNLIRVIGTSGSRLRNVAIRDLSLRNGTASTSNPTTGRDGVRVEYTDGFMLERVRIYEIEGWYGISVMCSTDIVARDCRFYRCTHTMMCILVECQNIAVQRNIFDTVTTTTQADCYTFCTGAEAIGFGSFYVRDLLVEDNQFLNNPRWEGIDCHGGENIVIRRNLVRNCKMGVALQHAHGYLADASTETLRNVLVADNTIDQGNGANGQAGISVVGNIYRLSEYIRVVGNDITGFTGQDSCPGSITMYWVQHVWIECNEIWSHGIYGVCFWEAVYAATIRSNRFFGANPTAAQDANCSAIGVVSVGAFGILVEDNTLSSMAANQTVKYLVRSASQYESWQIRNNSILHATQATPYNSVSTLPVERSSAPTSNLVQKYGDLIYGTSGKPGWVVSAPKIGYGSLDTSSTIVKGTIAAGSRVLTIVGGGSQDSRAIPAGMNIKIVGAGPAGAALNARVLEWGPSGAVSLDVTASTGVTAANVSYQSLSLVVV